MAARNKPILLAPPVARRVLDNLSKTALADLAWDLIVRGEGESEIEGRELEVLARVLEPVLLARGDAWPRGLPRPVEACGEPQPGSVDGSCQLTKGHRGEHSIFSDDRERDPCLREMPSGRCGAPRRAHGHVSSVKPFAHPNGCTGFVEG